MKALPEMDSGPRFGEALCPSLTPPEWWEGSH